MRQSHVAVVFFALLTATACGPAASGGPGASERSTEPAARPERTLVMAVRIEPQTMHPRPLGSPGVAIKASTRLFNAALDLVDDRGQPRAYLAEGLPQINTDSWRVLPDGRMETTYHLRPNVVWHDGTPLSAEDFVFSWRVYATPELGSSGSPPISLMEEAAAPDDRTVVIRWKRPYPGAGLLQSSGRLTDFPPMPRHILEASYRESNWEAFAAHSFWTREFIGLGPYRLERWDPGSSIEGVAFDRHVLGRPKIERVRLIFTPDANTGLAGLLAGTVHIAADNALFIQQGITAKREWAVNRGGTLLLTTDLYRGTYFQFRPEMMGSPALLDVRVRQALAHALDKQGLNDALYEGVGIPTETILPTTVDYHPVIDRAITKYPLDLRRSEQLMGQAGFTQGADGAYTSAPEGRLSIELKVNSSALYENERAIMADTWRKAGFDIQEAVLPANQAQDGQARATFPGMYSFSSGLGESALPNFTTTSIPSPQTRWFGSNRGAWSNPEYDRLQALFESTLDRNERIQQMARMTKLLSDELPAISLYYDVGAVPYVAALKGPLPVGSDTSGLVAWNVQEWELD